MKYLFQQADEKEIDKIFSLYRQRIAWMEKKRLSQWNATSYLETYPLSYFQTQQQRGNLYVLKNAQNLSVVAAVVLLDRDGRWPDEETLAACYVHNLVSSTRVKGAGKLILEKAEKLAAQTGKHFMRLDCATDNPFLNDYYQAMGYNPAGTCRENGYEGILREKPLLSKKRPKTNLQQSLRDE